MMLGKHFSLEELESTQTQYSNTADKEALVNLARLVALVLDPVRESVGTINVTSGYRSQSVNKAVGGSINSYHLIGCAADIVCARPIKDLFDAVVENGVYDKVIHEHGKNSEWVHVQIAQPGARNRMERLIARHIDGEMKFEMA